MLTRRARHEDLEDWVGLRHALWPDETVDELTASAKALLGSDDEVCFVATDESCRVVGFVEAALHPGSKGPYGHVEGWYVLPEFRKQGYGKELMGQIEQWCLHRTISILTSDTEAAYTISPAAHEGCGFRVIHELTIFLKELEGRGGE